MHYAATSSFTQRSVKSHYVNKGDVFFVVLEHGYDKFNKRLKEKLSTCIWWLVYI